MSTTATRASRANKELIAALGRSKLFRNYERVFGEATGLPLALRPLEYWQLAHRGKKHENPFCALLAERPTTLRVCLKAHEDMVRHTHALPHTVTCPFGLTETAVPLKVGRELIGFLRIGQVVRHAPSSADTTKVTETLGRCGVPFTKEIRNAWEHNVLIPPDKYSATVRLLAFFAEQLSALSNELITEKQNAEPLLVSKARAFIEEHKTDELSLNTVATAAGASVFHFCKVFHASTGLKFTDYVARVRVEDARTQLLNPTRRISEVAYQVGFQSLTQFNRTYKRVFGESPTDFRAKHSALGREKRAS